MEKKVKNLEFLKSDKYQKIIRNYFDKRKCQGEIYKKQVERFFRNNKDNMEDIIEKIIAKYSSTKYVRKEYKLGYVPREDLYWVLLSIAKKYGVNIMSNSEYTEYLNMFTSDAYLYNGYIVQRMDGQGSVVRIDKIKK